MVAAIHAAARRAAKAAGERFYDTGQPCKNGHLSKRYTGTGFCAMCSSLATQRVQAKKREHVNRIAARQRGDIHYSTGEPCKWGHDRRFVANGACTVCSPQWSKTYKNARPGLEASWARRRRAEDPTGHRAECKRWYHNNREAARAIQKRWLANNPERRKELGRIGANNRRAKILANGGRFTARDIEDIFERQRGCCAAPNCGRSDLPLEIDHIMPIKLGGSSDPHNLQLLCLPCNRAKRTKHPDEWLASLRDN